MPVIRENLSQCPRCDKALDASALQCSNCEYKDIENFDFLDVAEQREYKEHLQFQRAAWVEFDNALRKKLRELGEGWSKLGAWNQLWECIGPMADAVGFNE